MIVSSQVPSQVLQTRMSPNFCKFGFSLDMLKMIELHPGSANQKLT